MKINLIGYFIFLLIPFNLAAQEVKLLTWNTFLIPPPWNITKQKMRTQIMLKQLPKLEHEVIFFQEAFYDGPRKKIIHAMKKTHPFTAVPTKGKKIYHIQDSGLFAVSKYPMVLKDVVIFKDCAKADCLSSKSAMLVEVTLPSQKKVQFINTHLQAWNETKIYTIRRKQLADIKAMMARHYQTEIPQILVGDLNIDGNLAWEYHDSLSFMNMTSGNLIGDLNSTNGYSTEGCYKKPGEDGPGEWLDHVWINATTSAMIHSRKVLPIEGELQGKFCPLSDHYALEAVLSL